MLWKEDISVSVQNTSNRHIDAIIDLGMDDAWRFTSFYGNSDTASREDSWSLLNQLSQCISLPRVCVGDFNEILRSEEKQG